MFTARYGLIPYIKLITFRLRRLKDITITSCVNCSFLFITDWDGKSKNSLCINTGLFEMIVGVLATCHTQYT